MSDEQGGETGISIRDLRKILQEEGSRAEGGDVTQRIVPSASQRTGDEDLRDYIMGVRAAAIEKMEECLGGPTTHARVESMRTDTIIQAYLGVREQRDGARKMNVELTTRDQSLTADFANAVIEEYRHLFIELDGMAKVLMRMEIVLDLMKDVESGSGNPFMASLSREILNVKKSFGEVLRLYREGTARLQEAASHE